MINTLRKKLAWLMIIVISLVMLCAAALILFISERLFDNNERERLNIQADQLAQTVKMNEVLQTTQLAKLEVANGLIISIWDEGGEIPFRGGWQPVSDRNGLIAQIMAQLPEDYEKWDGSIKGDRRERYLVTVRRVSNFRYIRTVIILQDEQSADAQRFRQRWLYTGIAIVAMILISCVCWYATGEMVQPIREAHEQQNRFVSAASHDLRTPLQVIRVNAEALKLNPPNSNHFIDQILNELAHMGKLAEDLLSLTTASDHGEIEGNPVEIPDLVNATVAYFRNAAAQKGIELITNIPSQTLPLIEGNETMLQRALGVLIDNAVCYTPANGHVDVEVSLQAKKVIIAVRDDGPGIAPEHQSRVFDRFYRVDKSRTERAHSGLGLSIAKKILTDHGGQLIYKSAKPNGSVFCMVLPCLHISK